MPKAKRFRDGSASVRELGIACDGDSLTIGDTFSPSVRGGTDRWSTTDRRSAPRGRCATAAAMDLGASRATGELADQLGRQALFRRRRSGAVDRAIPAVDGDLAAMSINRRSFPMVHGSIGSARPGCSMPACSPAGRRSASCSIIEDGTAFWLRGRRRAMHRPRRAAAAAGRCRSPARRHGSYPWVGLPIRSWRDLRRRQVDHALQDIADHREMLAVAGILMHDVGEIGGGDIEPLRQQPRDHSATAGCLSQKRGGIDELVNVESAAARTVAVCGGRAEPTFRRRTAPGSVMLATTVSPLTTSSRPSIRT